MPEPAACRRCGAPLDPGAASCATCGTLAATAPQIGMGALLLGIVAGIAAGATALGPYFALLALAQTPGSCLRTWLTALAAFLGLLLVLGAFIFAVNVASRNPWLATFAITACIVFLIPATPCTIGIFGTVGSCR